MKIEIKNLISGCGGTADALVSGSSVERRVGSNPVIRTRKRLRIGYNSESFSTKSAYVGINPLSWMKSLRDEIPLTRGYGEADLISSEVEHRRFHPNSFGFHPAKQDFIF